MTLWYVHHQGDVLESDAKGEEEAFNQINIPFIDVDVEVTGFPGFPAFHPPPRMTLRSCKDRWRFVSNVLS